MSIAASGDGFTSSEDEGAVGLPPSGVVATAAPDPELMAMLALADVSIGLKVNRPQDRGRQDPQLPRRLAYPSPIQRAVGRSQGLGAPAPQPVGASGQLGKEQALPCAENLFSRCEVRLGEYDSCMGFVCHALACQHLHATRL